AGYARFQRAGPARERTGWNLVALSMRDCEFARWVDTLPACWPCERMIRLEPRCLQCEGLRRRTLGTHASSVLAPRENELVGTSSPSVRGIAKAHAGY